ncbi:MAG TPA: hypothetical protein PK974_07510, partial [Rhodocyclaceae bacterium]|nr:hypothetical protein [Rhodocyclaceae bacterium]
MLTRLSLLVRIFLALALLGLSLAQSAGAGDMAAGAPAHEVSLDNPGTPDVPEADGFSTPQSDPDDDGHSAVPAAASLPVLTGALPVRNLDFRSPLPPPP